MRFSRALPLIMTPLLNRSLLKTSSTLFQLAFLRPDPKLYRDEPKADTFNCLDGNANVTGTPCLFPDNYFPRSHKANFHRGLQRWHFN